jgi:CheY-like chemotaxis protein
MGGTITVDTCVNQGTTFTVTLPATEATDVPERVDDVPANPLADSGVSGTVLYVEDNVSNVRLMEVVLSKRPGITMVHAPDGETGLALMRERRPDLVLLDLHLPRLTGQEVLRRIWADPVTRQIPVVVLTADATATQMRALLASGAMAYLTKPVDVAAVFSVLDRLLKPAHGGESLS